MRITHNKSIGAGPMGVTVKVAKYLFILLMLTLSITLGKAGSPTSQKPVFQSQALLNSARPFSFTENKGQLADEKGKLLPDIHHYGQQNGVHVYCRNNTISFVFIKTIVEKNVEADSLSSAKIQTPGKTTFETSRIDMHFLNANPHPEIISETPSESYTNYFLGHTPEGGINHVKSYERLIYKNLYPAIDLVLLSKGNGIEYQFLVHPGGNPSVIKIQWDGTDKMTQTPEGGIHYENKLGEINETKPLSYTPAGILESDFKIENNIVSFKVGKYDASQTLTIDPVLIWGTYLGGLNQDFIGDILIDKFNNVLMSGYTSSSTGIATNGAFQITISGGYDVIIAKYNQAQNLLWATYYGGSNSDINMGLVCDASGYIYITGYTQSASGIATSSTFKTSFTGGNDIFISKFTTGGARVWGTYFGGVSSDNSNSIGIDTSGGLLICGYSMSNSGLTTAGAYKSSFSGSTDAFLAKFDTTGNRTWCSYYGGSYDEQANDLNIDSSGNICILGYTNSTYGIASSGAYQTSIYGGSLKDVFLAKFSNSGARLWGTYYGGANNDIGKSITSDVNGDYYITGQTLSSSGIATSGAFKTSYSLNQDAFLAKFSGSGNRIWGTYFGNDRTEEAGDIAVDQFGNLFSTGFTSSLTGIASTGAYQSSLGGGVYDSYITSGDTAGAINWTTYFGGSANDFSYKIALDTFGGLYISGNTQSLDKIANSRGQRQTYNGGQDVFIARFSFLPQCAFRTDIIGDTLLCMESTTIYKTKPHSGFNRSWSITGGIILNGNLSDSILVHWGPTGKGSLQLIETNDKCLNEDKIDTKINPVPVTKIWHIKLSDDKYIFLTNDTNYVYYKWHFGDGTDTVSTYHIEHTYKYSSTFRVRLYALDSLGCDAFSDTTLVVYTGIEDPSLSPVCNIKVNPNPFNSSTEIKCTLTMESNLQLILYDIAGREVSQIFKGKGMPGEQVFKIDDTNNTLDNGMYILKISVDDAIYTKKLIYTGGVLK